jgi:hypothetical protein
MPQARKARAVGFNHVALRLAILKRLWPSYGRLFDFELRGKSPTSAFLDLGDQFLALQKGRTQSADDGRHFGLRAPNKESWTRSRQRGTARLWALALIDTVKARLEYCSQVQQGEL